MLVKLRFEIIASNIKTLCLSNSLIIFYPVNMVVGQIKVAFTISPDEYKTV